MVNSRTVDRVLKLSMQGAEHAVEKMKKVKHLTLSELITSDDEDILYNDIVSLVNGVNTIYTAQIVDDISLPQRIVKVNYDRSNKREFVLVLRSKLKAQTKYIMKRTLQITKNLIDDINAVFAEFLSDLFLIEVANENVNELNEKLRKFCKEYLPYVIQFDINPEAVNYVTQISDDEIHFSVDIANAKYIYDLGFMSKDVEIETEASSDLLNSLLSVQTTTQLVKAKVDLIKRVTGIATKKHANKILRECYHRNAKYLDSLKTGDAYFSNIVMIDGEEVNVFAIIHKDIDGTLSVLLHPFDIDTLFNVDFDVLAEIKNER